MEKIRQSLLPVGLEVKATETSLKEKQDRKGWDSDLVGEAEVWELLPGGAGPAWFVVGYVLVLAVQQLAVLAAGVLLQFLVPQIFRRSLSRICQSRFRSRDSSLSSGLLRSCLRDLWDSSSWVDAQSQFVLDLKIVFL